MQCVYRFIGKCHNNITLYVLYHPFPFLLRLHLYLLRRLSCLFAPHRLRLRQTRAAFSTHLLPRQTSAGLPNQSQRNRRYNHTPFPPHRRRRFPRMPHRLTPSSFYFSFAVELGYLIKLCVVSVYNTRLILSLSKNRYLQLQVISLITFVLLFLLFIILILRVFLRLFLVTV